MKLKYILPISIAFAAIATSCLSDGSDTLVLNDATGTDLEDYLGIPPDNEADPNPQIDDWLIPDNPDQNPDNPGIIPDVPTVIDRQLAYGYITMSGIWDEKAGQWLTLYGTRSPQQNVWLSIDGKPKGIDVFNLSSTVQTRYPVLYDVVFLLDNDITMADEVAEVTYGMEAWALRMANAGIDLRVGFVAYSEGRNSVNGAMNLAPADEVVEHFNRAHGIAGTTGFGGADAEELQAIAESGDYTSGYNNECPMVALLFADDNFTFRENAARVYISMTDEPNQPGGSEKWSVERLAPANGFWATSKGTIHTIFSGRTDFTQIPLQTEDPWIMSEYTGGTVEFAPSDFRDISLEGATVTEALKHSYVIRFANVSNYLDGKPHKVKITVLTPDGSVAAEREADTVFFVTNKL